LFENLESAFKRNFFTDETDAVQQARMIHSARESAKEGKFQDLLPFLEKQNGAKPASE
jgi:hypothetical protein